MKIKTDYGDNRANMCFGTVEDRVKKDGGKLVFGWLTKHADTMLIEQVAHAVWERPDGTLLDIAPQLFTVADQKYEVIRPDEVEFEPDDVIDPAKPHCRYKAVNLAAIEAINCLNKSEQALWDGNEISSRHWTQKAQRLFKRFGYFTNDQTMFPGSKQAFLDWLARRTTS